MIKTVKIEKSRDFPIYADLYGNERTRKPLLIFVHGFKGFKNWGGFPYMLKKLTESGFKAAALNFSHNGVDNIEPMEFTKLELFAKNTFTLEIDELRCVIDHFCENAEYYRIDTSRIGIIGHSRGGGISILNTATDSRIKCLITLASVAAFDRYGENTKKIWRERGFLEMENTRTKQMMRLNSTLLDDLENNSAKLNITDAVSKIGVPFLIVHGKEDLSVKFTEAETLYNNSNKNSTELFLIENTGHTFGVVHPFSGTTDAFETVINKMKGFLKDHL